MARRPDYVERVASLTPFGRLLRERGLQQQAVADALAIMQGRKVQLRSAVSSWAVGLRLPPRDQQILLALLLNVPVDDLFPPDAEPEAWDSPDLKLIRRAKELARGKVVKEWRTDRRTRAGAGQVPLALPEQKAA